MDVDLLRNEEFNQKRTLMSKKISGCQKCRKIGEKLCSKAARCMSERRPTTPGQHGKKAETIKRSEYSKQLREKQKVKYLYGMRERQFERFFDEAVKKTGSTGETLLCNLERRLDNVVFRLKMASSRPQSRQMVVHGHVTVNGKIAKSPSRLVSIGDEITFTNRIKAKEKFVDSVVKKRLGLAIKVPEWLELRKDELKGVVQRLPVRADAKVPVQEHLIIELYSR